MKYSSDKNNYLNRERNEQMRVAYDAGFSVDEIAREHEVSRWVVAGVLQLKLQGVKTKTRTRKQELYPE